MKFQFIAIYIKNMFYINECRHEHKRYSHNKVASRKAAYILQLGSNGANVKLEL